MPKVYLSPAYHWYNTCSVSGCDETTHNNLYLDELEPYLRACGIHFKRGPRRTPKSDESGDALMIAAVAESNAWGADVHYVSHTNAFNGMVRGYRPIIYPGSTEGKRLAEKMIARRREIYDQPVTLNERPGLYELRSTNAVAYYEEHVFHDNPEDAAWFHAHLRDVARSAAQGLCDYFGISFVDPYGDAKPAAPDTPSPKPQAELTLPVLQRGSQGTAVTALQSLLSGLGYDVGGHDGIFGAKTLAALQSWQKSKGLSVTGTVDRSEWIALLGA